jgi:hypothetical protein
MDSTKKVVRTKLCFVKDCERNSKDYSSFVCLWPCNAANAKYVNYRKFCCAEHFKESDFYEVEERGSTFRKLQVDAVSNISINILPTIFFLRKSQRRQ